MVEADEGKGMMHILLVLPHYRYPGAFGTRVDLHQYVLNSGCFTRSLLQNNGEGKAPKNGGLSFLEQLSGSCSMTGHQRLSVLVKHKSTNVRLHKNPFPYGSLAEADSEESSSAVTFLSPMSRTSIAPKIVSCVLNACLHLCFQSRELRRHPRVGLLTCTQRSSSNDSLRLGYRFRVVSNPK